MCDNRYPAPPPPWADSRYAAVPMAPSSSATVCIPPMAAVVTPVEQPESASVRLLRSLLADRQRTKRDAEGERAGYERRAEEYDREANSARDCAVKSTAVISAASTEIAAILLDIEKLGGKPE